MTKAVTAIGAIIVATCIFGDARAEDLTTRPTFWSWAPTPPMGWNSWDCYGAAVTEDQTKANTDYMADKLKTHGWQYVVVDIQWYEPKAQGFDYRKDAKLEMDPYGRLMPAANRFPSAADGKGFTALADYVHGKGLKFGIHMMRGIPRQAIEQNTPVLGTTVHAADIADRNDTCRWNPDMYGVDMSKPGAQAYYDSVFALLASWEIDFVKVDDLSRPYHTAEIEAIRSAIDKCGRPIVLSTSPGATPVDQGPHVETHANQWRISDDFWDDWPLLYAQFSRLNAWTPFRAPGHWPDADMLPVGNVRTAENGWTHFTQDEQTTLMTLWCIARSPLIVGANLPKNDPFTLALLTNDEVIAVNQRSTNNRQLIDAGDHVVWIADVPDSKDKYVAIFNVLPKPLPREKGQPKPAALPPTPPAKIDVALTDLGFSGRSSVRDLWAGRDLAAIETTLSATVPSHGAVLYRVSPSN